MVSISTFPYEVFPRALSLHQSVNVNVSAGVTQEESKLKFFPELILFQYSPSLLRCLPYFC